MNPAARLHGLRPSPIRILTEGAPPDAIPLGLGEPTWELPAAARKALAHLEGSCPYGPNAGLPELRRAVATHHDAEVDEVLITCGSQGALCALFLAWLGPGDAVLVPDPGFPAYPALARLAGAEPVPYPLGPGNRLDGSALIQVLDAHPEARIVVLNHPANPTGAGASLAGLHQAAEACRARDVLLVSDEVYRDLHYGTRPSSLRDASPWGVVLGSLSKGWAAPGLRVGWAVGDPRWLAPARTVHAMATTAAPASSQRAALALLEDREAILARGRSEVAQRWEALAQAWLDHFGTALEPPDGAFYHWMELDAGEEEMAACLRLRDEAKVVLVPGSAFGARGKGRARLSFAARPEHIVEGIRRLATHRRPA